MTNRICGSCRHFVKIEGSATGHCTNPQVVSHQGRLVMYRAGEIGCRRGWKKDLWEPKLEDAGVAAAGTDVADVEIDYGRAAAWADSAPAPENPLSDLLPTTPTMNDDDLLDPRRTRDIREAIRRAREARKRELAVSANREPFDQPILARDERSGEDTVLDVRPAPLERTPPPIVPPVSVDEVQERVNEMRQPRRIHDLPPSVHFDRSDQHFSEIPERAARPSPPELSRLPEPAGFTPFAAPVTEFEPAESDPEPPLVDATLWPATAADDEGGLEAWAQTVHADEETSWPEQAPWADEPPPYEAWEERPKRRSWFGSLLHRQPRQPRVDPDASMRAWEPSPVDDHYPDDEPAPWEAQAGAEYDDRTAYDEPDVSELPPATRTLPPLPYDGDDEFRDDYLLADARYSDIDDEDHAARQIEHICATCRYFRRDGTCGNAFAFTFRRRVSEEYLSCASSIGVWWLPSDHYWESVVDVAHHGQPTPLLDRYAIRADEQESDDELRTP